MPAPFFQSKVDQDKAVAAKNLQLTTAKKESLDASKVERAAKRKLKEAGALRQKQLRLKVSSYSAWCECENFCHAAKGGPGHAEGTRGKRGRRKTPGRNRCRRRREAAEFSKTAGNCQDRSQLEEDDETAADKAR